jgi:hypothetical protein
MMKLSATCIALVLITNHGFAVESSEETQGPKIAGHTSVAIMSTKGASTHDVQCNILCNFSCSSLPQTIRPKVRKIRTIRQGFCVIMIFAQNVVNAFTVSVVYVHSMSMSTAQILRRISSPENRLTCDATVRRRGLYCTHTFYICRLN